MSCLNSELPASSLPECIVASVILMIVFLLSLDILSRLALTERTNDNVFPIVVALQLSFEELGDGLHPEGTYTVYHEGIKVEAELSMYHVYIQRLMLTACSEKGGLGVRRNHLIVKAHEK